MEKLQKQYANDKNMYQQKVMELQKANGYNPLGACVINSQKSCYLWHILGSFAKNALYKTHYLFSNFYGAVALGVIVFTLALKTLVLPLDIYSRVKTKKQSLLMERMRPQMEKLQKQYAYRLHALRHK